MDRQGYIEYNSILSPEYSGKANSYARAIKILGEVLPYQNVLNLYGCSLYEISDIETIEELERLVKLEVVKLRNHEENRFNHGHSNQLSCPLKNFCSVVLRSLKGYAQYEHAMKVADVIVAYEHNAWQISRRLITHFDLTKEGTDAVSQTKHREGHGYFRHMILDNYDGKCALTRA